MQVSMRHQDLFATRVWEFDCQALALHFARWREQIESMRQLQPRAEGRSNRAGWNSAKTLFDHPDFQPLHRLVRRIMQTVLEQMSVSQAQFVLEAWANVNDPGGYNISHVHPGAWLSASFYLTVPTGSGAIVLHDPRAGAVHSTFQGKGINHCQAISVTPQEGLLLVFPSWLEHHVDSHEGTVPRVSIAINAYGHPMTIRDTP